MSLDEEFDKYFEKEGGNVKVNHEDSHYQRLTDFRNRLKLEVSLTSSLPAACMPDVYLGFVNNKEFGASAKLVDGKYYIGVNIGVNIILSHVFAKLMATNSVLPDVGNVKLESEESQVYDLQYTNSTQVLSDIQSADQLPRPKCPKRALIANAMADYALEFLIMHEYAHICNGHLDLIKSAGSAVMTESQFNAFSEGLNPLDRQTLEMDADSSSTLRSLKKLIRIHHDPASNTQYLSVVPSFEQSYSIWYSSIYTMLRLLGKSTPKIDQQNCSHPPSGLRQFLIFNTAHTIIEMLKLTSIVSNSYPMFANTISQIESAFRKISEIEVNAEAMKFSLKPESGQLLRRYLRNWATLRPRLEKFAYVNLAPVQSVREE